MTEKNDEKINEICVIHEKKTLDSSEYISVQLKSSELSVDNLIQKALDATVISGEKQFKKVDAIL